MSDRHLPSKEIVLSRALGDLQAAVCHYPDTTFGANAKAILDEIERLRGLKPQLPPGPPDGSGLPRYGLRHNGPGETLATPMEDGYWTPWHLADRAHGFETFVHPCDDGLRAEQCPGCLGKGCDYCNEGMQLRPALKATAKTLAQPKVPDVLSVLMAEEISAMHDELKANAQKASEHPCDPDCAACLADKVAATLPPCECLLLDKAPSAYHALKCPRYVVDKL